MVKQWMDHEGVALDSKGSYEVIECEACQFKHIVPIPSEEELSQVYKEDFWTKENPNAFARISEDADWWSEVISTRYSVFEEHLGADRRRILDVGSGSGLFLQIGKKRGWEVLGVEPSRYAAEFVRKQDLPVVNEFLSEQNVDQLGHFDVVHLHEVLEHVPDPARLLNLAYSLLLPGGILCVIVPNDYNPLQQVLRTVCDYQPWWLAPPHHINYFNFASLSALVNKMGFEVIRKTATFPMELFLLMGDNYVGDDQKGRMLHGKRKQLEMRIGQAGFGDLWGKVYSGFAEAEIGREVVLYAKKPSTE